MLKRFVDNLSENVDPLVLFISIIFIAGMAWQNVSAQADDVSKLKADNQNVNTRLARIEQKVDDIHDALNLPGRTYAH